MFNLSYFVIYKFCFYFKLWYKNSLVIIFLDFGRLKVIVIFLRFLIKMYLVLKGSVWNYLNIIMEVKKNFLRIFKIRRLESIKLK